MADNSFAAALNEQIANEFGAHQQYIGAAVYYDSETLPRLAAFFYRQAVEERNHAMIMVQYLLDTDEEVRIPDIESKRTSFDDAVAPVRMALEQEERVGEEINALFKLARDNGEYRAEQFMQWFVKEQVEEVALMQDLLNVVERSSENLLQVEDYLARERPARTGTPRRRRPPAARCSRERRPARFQARCPCRRDLGAGSPPRPGPARGARPGPPPKGRLPVGRWRGRRRDRTLSWSRRRTSACL